MRRAFTLLEVLIATGMFMVIMVVAISVFATTVSGTSTTEQTRVNAQAARYAFESMTREIRLSHGLVYVSDNLPTVVIPPFETTTDPTDAQKLPIINVYQVKKDLVLNSAGEATYKVSRKVYFIKEGQLVVADEVLADRFTAQELFQRIGNLNWPDPPPAPQPLLPKGYVASQFVIRRQYNYPAPGASLDLLENQPYLQIDLTAENLAYNQGHDTNKQIRTTLRTTMVPRNFLSPFDVSQPGVQGATQ